MGMLFPNTQARSHGGAALAERLEGRQRVLQLQARTVEALQEAARRDSGNGGGDGGTGGGRAAEAGHAAAELQETPQDLAALYNDYAAQFQVASAPPPPDVGGYTILHYYAYVLGSKSHLLSSSRTG